MEDNVRDFNRTFVCVPAQSDTYINHVWLKYSSLVYRSLVYSTANTSALTATFSLKNLTFSYNYTVVVQIDVINLTKCSKAEFEGIFKGGANKVLTAHPWSHPQSCGV